MGHKRHVHVPQQGHHVGCHRLQIERYHAEIQKHEWDPKVPICLEHCKQIRLEFGHYLLWVTLWQEKKESWSGVFTLF